MRLSTCFRANFLLLLSANGAFATAQPAEESHHSGLSNSGLDDVTVSDANEVKP